MAKYIDPGRIAGPVYIPNCIAVRLFWELPNDKMAYNVLHAQYDSIPTFTQASVNSLFDAIKGHLTSSGLATALDTETSLTKLGVRDMREDVENRGFAEWVSNTSAVTGAAVGGGPLPQQLAFVVSLKTGFAGPANRGRVYIPGFNSGADDGNGVAKATVGADAVEFVTGVQTALDSAGFNLCIAQPARKAYTGASGTAHPAREASTTIVTSISHLNLHWDTQRLRARL